VGLVSENQYCAGANTRSIKQRHSNVLSLLTLDFFCRINDLVDQHYSHVGFWTKDHNSSVDGSRFIDDDDATIQSIRPVDRYESMNITGDLLIFPSDELMHGTAEKKTINRQLRITVLTVTTHSCNDQRRQKPFRHNIRRR
jgi:hypothetical protein